MISLWKKVLIIIAGSSIAGAGLSIAVHAGFGSATLAVLWQGVARQFSISLGQASLLVSALMIFAIFFYDRRQIHVGTIIYQCFYSLAVDVFGKLHIKTGVVIIDFGIMLFGILILGIGTGLYTYTDMGRGAYEAVCFALARKKGWQIKYVRAVCDIVCVLLGCAMGGKAGLCTLVTIFFVGPVIQKTLAILTQIEKDRKNRSRSK